MLYLLRNNLKNLSSLCFWGEITQHFHIFHRTTTIYIKSKYFWKLPVSQIKVLYHVESCRCFFWGKHWGDFVMSFWTWHCVERHWTTLKEEGKMEILWLGNLFNFLCWKAPETSCNISKFFLFKCFLVFPLFLYFLSRTQTSLILSFAFQFIPSFLEKSSSYESFPRH